MADLNLNLNSKFDPAGFKQMNDALDNARGSFKRLGGSNKQLGNDLKNSTFDVSKLKQGLAGLGQAFGVSSYIGQWSGMATAISTVAIALKSIKIPFSLTNQFKDISKFLREGSMKWQMRGLMLQMTGSPIKGRFQQYVAGNLLQGWGTVYEKIAKHGPRTLSMHRGILSPLTPQRVPYQANMIQQGGVGSGLVVGAAALAFFVGVTKLGMSISDEMDRTGKGFWGSVGNKLEDWSTSYVNWLSGVGDMIEEEQRVLSENIAQANKTGISLEGTKRAMDFYYDRLMIEMDPKNQEMIKKQMEHIRTGKAAEAYYDVSLNSIGKEIKKNALMKQGATYASAGGTEAGIDAVMEVLKNEMTKAFLGGNNILAAKLKSEMEKLEDVKQGFDAVKKESGGKDFKSTISDNVRRIGAFSNSALRINDTNRLLADFNRRTAIAAEQIAKNTTKKANTDGSISMSFSTSAYSDA